MRHLRRYRRLLRRPLPYWLATAVLVALTVSAIGRATESAAAARDRWGRLVPATVALHDLEPGDVVDAGDVETRLLPAGVVPGGAFDGDAVGEVVTAWTARGEVLLERRLSNRLPPGTRGIAVPHGLARLPVEVGDRVDLLATDDVETVTVAFGAIVVHVADDAVTVAVDERDVERVASAVTVAAVTLVLT